MTFQPKDPNFEEKVRSSFARQSMMASLGIEMSKVQPGEIDLVMPFNTAYAQQHGFLHAGSVATGLDTACGYAAHSLMPPEAAVLTAEFKINLLSPAKGDSFRFVGRVIKPGKTLTFCEAQCHGVSGTDRKLIATMAATVMAVYDRPGIEQ